MEAIFSNIDTSLEYGESALAVFLLILGLGLGTFISRFIYPLLAAVVFLLLIALPVLAIDRGIVTGWHDVAIDSVIFGGLLGFVLFPLTSVSQLSTRVKELETKLLKSINDKQE
jgi:predicted PurR-regulated permease PerM